MKKKLLLFGTIVLVLTFSQNGALWAQSLDQPSYPARVTPFDDRLAGAGFFEASRAADRGRPAPSVQDLFSIARSFRYVPDTTGDRWQKAEETGMKKSGDCEDKAVWLYKQLKSNGYDNISLVVGRYRSMDPALHVWVLYVDNSGNTYALDPTIQKRPWKIQDFPEGFYQPLYSYRGENLYRRWQFR